VEALRAERFAKVLLDENRHEKVFEVDLGRGSSVEAVAKALRDLGCTVEELGNSRLRVHCEDAPST
jgi:hypothetical protein